MLNKEQALSILRKYIKTENTIKHLLATEAIMRALAKRFSASNGGSADRGGEPENEAEWAMAGLLHDIDYEQFKDGNYDKHGELSIKILKREGADLPETVYAAIKAHAFVFHPDWQPKNKMEWSLFICDSLTGLIVATTLVRPERKLVLVEVKSIMKKFKNKSFAAGTRREDIKLCQEKLGISLEEFMDLSLKAMQGIAKELGL